MGMSTHVVGIRPPDNKWKSMKAVWDACKAVEINPPPEVLDFFGHQEPDNAGLVVHLDTDGDCVREWHTEEGQGYEVILGKLPAKITIVRFYNSW